MDLRSEYPRSLRVKVGDYMHLARMIDKCRAKQAGLLGEYMFPCPIDQIFLGFLDVSEESFFEIAAIGTDVEVLDWVHSLTQQHAPQDIEDLNMALLHRKPDTDEKRSDFNQLRNAIDPTRTDITTWADMLDLDEGRDVPLRS